MIRTSALLSFVALAAAAVARPAPSDDWRAVATAADRARLRGWRRDFVAALAAATQAGRGSEVAAAGVLLDPDAARGDPVPPPGRYRCRTTKLGAKMAGMPAFLAYPVFPCRIERTGAVLSFAKLDGSQRPVGRLFPDRGGERLVFLGTMTLGDERRAQVYGRDAERDMIGALERIGPQRWRLVLPQPRWESLIDVIELVPEA